MNLCKDLRVFQTFISGARYISSHTSGITKVHRITYSRTYPTLMVLPNGATFHFRYPEPRVIVRLPLNIDTLNDNEKRARLEKRKPRERMILVDTDKINYNPSKYLNLVKKKK